LHAHGKDTLLMVDKMHFPIGAFLG